MRFIVTSRRNYAEIEKQHRNFECAWEAVLDKFQEIKIGRALGFNIVTAKRCGLLSLK